MVTEGLSEEVTFELRPGREEGGRHSLAFLEEHSRLRGQEGQRPWDGNIFDLWLEPSD